MRTYYTRAVYDGHG